MATMLGFLDDVFDIRWRHKLPIPIIASIPLLIVYYSERGATDVVVPLPLRWLLGTLINLGPLYYVYMSLLSTFCTNSINILAGINGSEVSQAVVIALSIILNDLLFLPWAFGFRIPLPLHVTDGVRVGGVWSAGMAFDPETQLLHPSRVELKEKRPSWLASLVLRVFSALGLVELTLDERTGEIAQTTNLTILNVFLIRLGPMREDSLTRVLIATQLFAASASTRIAKGALAVQTVNDVVWFGIASAEGICADTAEAGYGTPSAKAEPHVG
ncbi:hypothetical protein BN946_scf184801.g52 [Trametes cinnabarina]|uniref:UDP-N-acetylglucosamine--dolichyl-phosphate N-acetylglucosaminephosphotransferase n=1 Tax=Pycnoporus cinnabarinus TaxID=5643 RepID=A0A060SF49_PYCCI|nr:hypothetical protein BN946_scf184801.g52 [Trametes cinnabarina]